jgi:hypothetical protein
VVQVFATVVITAAAIRAVKMVLKKEAMPTI